MQRFDEVLQEVIEQYQAGQSAASIGKHYKVSHQTILNWLRSAGVKIRRGNQANKQPRFELTCPVCKCSFFPSYPGRVCCTRTCTTQYNRMLATLVTEA